MNYEQELALVNSVEDTPDILSDADVQKILSEFESFRRHVDDEVMTQAVAPTKPPANQVVLRNDGAIDRDAEKLARMSQVIGKFATTLALKPVRVDLSTKDHNGAASWSDNETITFHKDSIGKLDEPEVVAALKGLGLHEVAHIMLTPQLGGSKFTKKLQADDLLRSFNVLEDQRIETHLTSLFSNVDDWLTAATIQQLVKNPTEAAYQYPLLAGRKYLPPELRRAYRDVFEDPTMLDEMDTLIDEYVGFDLNNPKTYPRAHEVIKRFHELVQSLEESKPPQGGGQPEDGSQPPQENYNWTDCGWDKISEQTYHPITKPNGEDDGKGKPQPLTPQQLKDLADKVKDKVAKAEPLPPADNTKPYEPPTPSNEQGGEPGDGEGDGKGEGEQGDDGDEPANGVGKGGGGLQAVLDDTLKDLLNRKQKDIRNAIAQFNGEVELDGRTVKAPPKHPYNLQHKTVDPKTVRASKSFTRELELLRADYDPGWELKTDQGRINVQRYMTGGDVEEAFDQWDMGREDAVDIECVIILDNSGSMHSVMSNAYQSMWAIKRALDKIGASTTVVTFASTGEEYTLYAPHERAEATYRDIGTGGGTEPVKALRYARSVLAQSNRAIKILIPITDGEWYRSEDSDDIIRNLRKGGVLTALGMIGAGSLAHGDVIINTHGCEVAVPIDDMTQLFVLAKDMVRSGIKRNLTKA